MTTALMILLPCCLVGAAVGVAVARWQPLPDQDEDHVGGYGEAYAAPGRAPRTSRRPLLPPLPPRHDLMDWPIPQLERLSPAVLVGIATALAVWVVSWVVLAFVGFFMLAV